MRNTFIEVDHYQVRKHSQNSAGDVFLSQKTKPDGRVISVLADGLGSGIKARVLATLTTTMALRFVSSDININKAARIIMNTLPVCRERRIGYSTFTIVDIERPNNARIMEYDNPPYILLRGDDVIPVEKRTATVTTPNLHNQSVHFSRFEVKPGDRIVFFSDGIDQSGMGKKQTPLGWGHEAVETYAREIVAARPEISAREMSRKMVQRAVENDTNAAKDDITCACIYFRKPRTTLVVTGPPIAKEKDRELAETVREFDGKKAICGGTTANIIGRELDRKAVVNLADIDPVVPPTSRMDGIDLITEGTITIGKVVELLERGTHPDMLRKNAATKLLSLLLESDIINFVVGTKINDAHQDPNVPVELDIRRNIIKKLIQLLEEKYLKETSLRFI